ncbi:hypothetical protein D1AOALGA4SA_12695 [Olavius algarvensis Delta 1 endosymbiont]|nr:hypothetical protein D1AOALGA4SA_12695 [Olavius algarvensis Delta 1 endosymbiont]
MRIMVSRSKGGLMKLESFKTNRRISNKKYRMMKCGIASL